MLQVQVFIKLCQTAILLEIDVYWTNSSPPVKEAWLIGEKHESNSTGPSSPGASMHITHTSLFLCSIIILDNRTQVKKNNKLKCEQCNESVTSTRKPVIANRGWTCRCIMKDRGEGGRGGAVSHLYDERANNDLYVNKVPSLIRWGRLFGKKPAARKLI